MSFDQDIARAKRQLVALDRNIGGSLPEAVMAGLEPIYVESQRLVPVDTGDLKRSGSTDLVDVTPDRVIGEVAYGGGRVIYHFFVEYGTSRMPAQPYLRPAADRQSRAAAEEMNRVILANDGV